MSRKLLILFSLILVVAFGFNSFEKKIDGSPTDLKAPFVQVDNSTNYIPSRPPTADNINALWTESFNTLALPTGWLNVPETSSNLWTFVASGTYPTTTPHSGAGMATYQSFSYQTGVTSLISSSFSLTAGQAKLGFWMVRDAGYATSADLVDFMINTSATSTGATLLGTINRSKTLAPVETGADGWYYYEFTIPASFNTATNYIILRATTAYGNNMYVDDVSVSLLLANDVGVNSIDVTTPIMPGATVPKATVKNFGTASQTFPVTMTITPGGYTSTKTVTALTGGSTNQVSFDSWTPANGTYSIKVISQLGTDQDRTNDTLVKSVLVSDAVWTSGAVIPGGSYLGSGVGYSRSDTTFLFALGGNTPNGTAIYKYNVTSNTWTAGATMPATRVVLASAIVRDTVYAIGGSNGTNYANTLYKYSINTNTWTTGTPLPTATLGWCKAGGYQDSLIYVVGGNDGTNVVATVYVYNAISGTWRTGTALPVATFGGACAITDNYIVYVGGIGTAPVATTYRGLISQTDRSTITWTTGLDYPGGVMWKWDAAPWNNGQIIATTGTNGTTSTTWWTPATPNPCYAYNPTTNVWTAKINLATPVLGAYVGSTKLGNMWKLLVASGYSGSAAVTNTQIFTEIITGINNPVIGETPSKYALSQNYPNPFNPVTKINYALPKSGLVTMKVYDILGKEVATLVNEVKNAGVYSVEFNASKLASGMYIYKIESNGFSEVKKMMLIK